MAIDDVIYVVWNGVSREIFFQGDRVGEPITPIEIQLRIKLMMHDRSQLSGRQWRITQGYRLPNPVTLKGGWFKSRSGRIFFQTFIQSKYMIIWGVQGQGFSHILYIYIYSIYH